MPDTETATEQDEVVNTTDTVEDTPGAQSDAAPDDDVERLRADLTKVRQENARRRVSERQATERVKAILAAAGVGDDSEDPAQEVARLRQELNRERLTNALHRAARAASADPSLLIPYLTGAGRLNDIDTDDPTTLDAEVLTRVQAALAEQPKLAAVTGPATPERNGGEPPTGTKPRRNFTRAELERMTPTELIEAEDDIADWQRRGSPGI